MFTKVPQHRHLAQHIVVVRRLMRIAPAQRFEACRSVPHPEKRVVERQRGHVGAGLDRGDDWTTSHQAEAPSMSRKTRSRNSGSTWVKAPARGPSSSRISRA
jgi:hypothetical protein